MDQKFINGIKAIASYEENSSAVTLAAESIAEQLARFDEQKEKTDREIQSGARLSKHKMPA